jgi:uncharacterized membrane protein
MNLDFQPDHGAVTVESGSAGPERPPHFAPPAGDPVRTADLNHPRGVTTGPRKHCSVSTSGHDRPREHTKEEPMAATDNTFIYVATYPNEAAAQADYQVVKDLHAGGLVGSYDAAVVTKDTNGKVHANKDETATRHGAWWGVAAGAALGVLFPPSIIAGAGVGAVVGGVSGHLAKGMSRSDVKELGDFIDPGQAGLVVVGESKVEEAVQNAVTRAEKQTAEDLGVDPKDIDKALQEALKDM